MNEETVERTESRRQIRERQERIRRRRLIVKVIEGFSQAVAITAVLFLVIGLGELLCWLAGVGGIV